MKLIFGRDLNSDSDNTTSGSGISIDHILKNMKLTCGGNYQGFVYLFGILIWIFGYLFEQFWVFEFYMSRSDNTPYPIYGHTRSIQLFLQI